MAAASVGKYMSGPSGGGRLVRRTQTNIPAYAATVKWWKHGRAGRHPLPPGPPAGLRRHQLQRERLDRQPVHGRLGQHLRHVTPIEPEPVGVIREFLAGTGVERGLERILDGSA